MDGRASSAPWNGRVRRRRRLRAAARDGRRPRDRAARPAARSLLAALDGTRSAGRARARLRRRARPRGARRLGELGAARGRGRRRARRRAERARYDRQLRYFSDLAAAGRAASEYQRRLREARVRVLGARRARELGGVRARLLRRGRARARGRRPGRGEQLQPPDPLPRARRGPPEGRGCRGGARGVRLGCRLDRRRAPARERGRPCARWSRAATSWSTAADWPAHDIERWVNAACFAAGVPFITMSHSPPVARVGPLYVPGTTGCFACQERTYRDSFPLYDELVEQRRGRPSPAATLGPVCAFVGGQVALEALHQLTGLCPPATLGIATSTTCGRWR